MKITFFMNRQDAKNAKKRKNCVYELYRTAIITYFFLFLALLKNGMKIEAPRRKGARKPWRPPRLGGSLKSFRSRLKHTHKLPPAILNKITRHFRQSSITIRIKTPLTQHPGKISRP